MINRRSLVAALTKATATLSGLAGASSAMPYTQTSGNRSLQKKVDEVASLADHLEIKDFDDVSFAARLAFDHANTRDGRGTSFRVPPRVLTMKAPLQVPDRIVLVGSGMRDTIFHAQHDGPMFVFRDVEHAGLCNARLGLGNRPGTQGIKIEARDGDTRRLSFSNLEIVGGGSEGSGRDGIGQVGVYSAASERRIISECTFDRLILAEVDQPVVERSTEGNEWTRFVIDQFGYKGGIGFNSIANANHYQGRIAGSPAAGAIGFRQGGYRNMLLLRIDIGNAARALDLAPDTRNMVFLQRPAEARPTRIQTPLGRVAGSTVFDGDEGTSG